MQHHRQEYRPAGLHALRERGPVARRCQRRLPAGHVIDFQAAVLVQIDGHRARRAAGTP